jgi:hypothetical protein
MEGSKCHIQTKTRKEYNLSTGCQLLDTKGKVEKQYSADKYIQHYHATFLTNNLPSYQAKIQHYNHDASANMLLTGSMSGHTQQPYSLTCA